MNEDLEVQAKIENTIAIAITLEELNILADKHWDASGALAKYGVRDPDFFGGMFELLVPGEDPEDEDQDVVDLTNRILSHEEKICIFLSEPCYLNIGKFAGENDFGAYLLKLTPADNACEIEHLRFESPESLLGLNFVDLPHHYTKLAPRFDDLEDEDLEMFLELFEKKHKPWFIQTA